MKNEMPEMRKEHREQAPASPSASGNLDKAIARIYERYGSDLPAFFRDAYREATLKHREAAEDIEVCRL